MYYWLFHSPVKQQPCIQCLLTASHTVHTSKSSQAQPTLLLARGKWNKIKQNCLNTPASAAQSDSVHLDFCWIFQMVNSGMLEKVIFYLRFFFYMPALISISWKERSQELLELTQSPLSGPLMSVISIRKFLKQLKINTTHMFSWYVCQSIMVPRGFIPLTLVTSWLWIYGVLSEQFWQLSYGLPGNLIQIKSCSLANISMLTC